MEQVLKLMEILFFKEIEVQKELGQKRVKELMDLHEKHLGVEEMEKVKALASEIGEKELKDMTERCFALRKKIISAIEDGLREDSLEVQKLMQEHFKLSTIFKPMTKKQYLSSREFLNEDSDFYKMYAKDHEKMPDFLYKAMGVFASNNIFEKEN